jgi:PPOX class probable F420-dependent enzyme
MGFAAVRVKPSLGVPNQERFTMVAIPEGYESLLERPLFGHLATVRPDGSPQVNAMWFDWDGELLRFTHTTKRQKYRNIAANPKVAMSVIDPDNSYRFIEVRGVVEEVVPDPTGAFYMQLNDRYSGPLTEPPADKADRVVLVVRPSSFSKL